MDDLARETRETSSRDVEQTAREVRRGDEYDAINRFLDSCKPINDAARERELIALYQSAEGEQKELALRAIIKGFARFAFSLAMHSRGRGLSPDDLFVASLVGIWKAADRFDSSLGYRFTTFSARHVKNRVRLAIYKNGTRYVCHVPAHAQAKFALTFRAERLFRKRFGRDPGEDELIAAISELSAEKGIDQQALVQSLRLVGLSFDAPNAAFAITDEAAEDPEELLRRKRLHEVLRKALATLTPIEQSVVSGLFDLNGEGEKSLRALAFEHGFSHEWVRKIGERALKNLHEQIDAESHGVYELL